MSNIKFASITLCLFAFLFSAIAASAQPGNIDQRVKKLLKQMTLEEKVGQLTQYSGDRQATGPITFKGDHREAIRSGKIGSMLNVLGTRYTRSIKRLRCNRD